jgi:hypothetical protein
MVQLSSTLLWELAQFNRTLNSLFIKLFDTGNTLCFRNFDFEKIAGD